MRFSLYCDFEKFLHIHYNLSDSYDKNGKFIGKLIRRGEQEIESLKASYSGCVWENMPCCNNGTCNPIERYKKRTSKESYDLNETYVLKPFGLDDEMIKEFKEWYVNRRLMGF